VRYAGSTSLAGVYLLAPPRANNAEQIGMVWRGPACRSSADPAWCRGLMKRFRPGAHDRQGLALFAASNSWNIVMTPDYSFRSICSGRNINSCRRPGLVSRRLSAVRRGGFIRNRENGRVRIPALSNNGWEPGAAGPSGLRILQKRFLTTREQYHSMSDASRFRFSEHANAHAGSEQVDPIIFWNPTSSRSCRKRPFGGVRNSGVSCKRQAFVSWHSATRFYLLRTRLFDVVPRLPALMLKIPASLEAGAGEH